MVTRTEIVEFLNDYLKTDEIPDSSWNGLQYEGSETVKKIALAVDASIETITKAQDADMLIVHHGLFWKTTNPNLTGYRHERIRLLSEANLSLYASHLPLDCHRIVGNNAQLIALLGAQISEDFAIIDGKPIGYIAHRENPLSIREAERILKDTINAQPITLPYGPQHIHRIAVLSGGGSYRECSEALECNADLYITGDTSEIHSLAKDAKMNVIFAGHYATETVGVKALGSVLEELYGITCEFIDVPSGL